VPVCRSGAIRRLGVFSYSDEETSASYHLDAKVDGRTIYNRRRRLMAIQRKNLPAAKPGPDRPRRASAGRGPSPETDLLWQARLATQAPDIDGVCLVNDVQGQAPRAGDFRRLRITAAHDYDRSARCSRRRGPPSSSYEMPHLQEKSRRRRSLLIHLQRTLPPAGSGQLGHRELPDSGPLEVEQRAGG